MKAYEKEIYEHIKIWGRTGTWYEIDKKFVKDKLYVLFESEQGGDETSCLLVEDISRQNMKVAKLMTILKLLLRITISRTKMRRATR